MFDSFHDVTEGPVCVLSIVDSGDLARSFTTSDNTLFLSAFVDYSTDITAAL